MTYPTGGGESTNPEIWKLYMHLYGHGVKKKRVPYLFHPERELMSTGNLLNLLHYQPTLRLCFRRWQAS